MTNSYRCLVLRRSDGTIWEGFLLRFEDGLTLTGAGLWFRPLMEATAESPDRVADRLGGTIPDTEHDEKRSNH